MFVVAGAGGRAEHKGGLVHLGGLCTVQSAAVAFPLMTIKHHQGIITVHDRRRVGLETGYQTWRAKQTANLEVFNENKRVREEKGESGSPGVQ